MEKLLYILQKPEEINSGQWHASLLDELLPAVAGVSVLEARLFIPDQQVASASGLVQANVEPVADALISAWLDTHLDHAVIDQLLEACTAGFTGHLICESVPLAGDAAPGSEQPQRLPGFTQVAFLERPANLDEDQWLQIWQHSHTSVAVEIQSNYRYVQNRVIGRFVGNSPWNAIVTESFPEKAMSDMTVFYDCEGDEATMQQRLGQMIDSCARFMDFTRLNVLPCSEYRLNGR